MNNRQFAVTLIFACTVIFCAAHAAAQTDPGLADTVIVDDLAWDGSGAVGLQVDLVNDERLAGLSLGFHWDDDLLVCDSVTFNTSRVGAGQTDVSIVNIEQNVLTGVLYLIDDWYETGTGHYCTIWFHYDGVWDAASEANIDSTSIVPGGDYLLVDYETANGFVPQTVPGKLQSSLDAEGDFGGDALPLTQLFPCYPNPFNPSTTIAFAVAKRGRVRLEIFDILGRKVRTVADRVFPPGSYEVVWRGRDDTGARVSSGVYFYRLTAGEFVQSRALVLVK
jgi:hypothetical protein